MKRKVQIEVVGPVQDPSSGEVLIQPGTRFDEGAAELEGLPAHMLRAVLSEEDGADDKAADKPADKPVAKPAVAGKSA